MKGIALLVGLGPLIGWGLFPTIAAKIGGKPVNQIIGATFGTFIFADRKSTRLNSSHSS